MGVFLDRFEACDTPQQRSFYHRASFAQKPKREEDWTHAQDLAVGPPRVLFAAFIRGYSFRSNLDFGVVNVARLRLWRI